MKEILRVAVGTLFFISFLLLLFTSAVKTELLHSRFWVAGLANSGAYEEIVTELSRKAQGPLPPEIVQLAKTFTAPRLKELVEPNIDRFLDYINGKTPQLLLHLPLGLKGLPPEVGLAELGAILKAKPAQIQEWNNNLKLLSQVPGWITIAWWILIIVSAACLVGHYFLGEPTARQAETIKLMALAGLLTGAVGTLGTTIGNLIAQNAKDLPVWGRALIRDWANKFFALGQRTGWLVGLTGLGIWVLYTWVLKLDKSNQPNWLSWVIKRVLGIGLGLAIVLGLTIGISTVLGAKFHINRLRGWQTFHSEQYGYSLKYPSNWEVKENSTENTRELWISAKDKTAAVKINAYHEPGMDTQAKVTQSIAAMKQKMYTDKDLRVTAFKDSFEGQVGGYIAQGYQKINGEDWRFENRGLLATNDRVLVMHGAVKPPSPAAQWKIIYEIMKSFALDKNK